MIAFRYTKTGGAEFISHLDTLRHLNKTFKRAGIDVKMSQGFHPHMLVYMSSPIAVGLTSYAEYCAVEADIPAVQFIEKFNAASPKGIKCVAAFNVDKNPNFASCIDRAEYFIEGLAEFDAQKVLGMAEFEVTDKRGNQREVRGKIYSLENKSGGLVAVLAAGNDALRPDVFCEKLKQLYGGGSVEITKNKSFVGDREVDDLFR